MRCLRHRLHPRRYDDPGIAEAHHAGGIDDSGEARQAHLVDRGCVHIPADARADRRLARGVLARARGQHLPDQNRVDDLGADPGFLKRAADRDAAERRGRQR